MRVNLISTAFRGFLDTIRGHWPQLAGYFVCMGLHWILFSSFACWLVWLRVLMASRNDLRTCGQPQGCGDKAVLRLNRILLGKSFIHVRLCLAAHSLHRRKRLGSWVYPYTDLISNACPSTKPTLLQRLRLASRGFEKLCDARVLLKPWPTRKGLARRLRWRRCALALRATGHQWRRRRARRRRAARAWRRGSGRQGRRGRSQRR
jgi:hypothetical protein